MHNSVDIAQIFLDKAEKDNKGLTPMQLLKLTYIAHGWMLGIHGKPLINEPIEAWQYGPVIRNLYAKIKKHRSNFINEKISNNTPELSDDEQEIIDETFEKYGDYTGWELSNITHKQGTPWDKYKDTPVKTIPMDDIFKYYRDLNKA